MERRTHDEGCYDYLTGIAAFSSGVRVQDGYEVVRCTFPRVVPWRSGFDTAEATLASNGVAPAALCAVELRCERPYSADGFDAFNETYVERLLSMGVFAKGDDNPVARTNVAPVRQAPDEQGMFAFSFVRPSTVDRGPSFVIAGGGEVRGGAINETTIVRFGETSDDAIGEKATFVMDVMEKRLTGLGLAWADARTVNVYTRHATPVAVQAALADRMGSAVVHGVHYYDTAPPVTDIEFEMDVKSPTWEQALP